jgi:hypothetical protein
VVWRRLDDVPPKPRPWLYGIARRALANRRGEHRTTALRQRITNQRRAGATDVSGGMGASCGRSSGSRSPIANWSPPSRDHTGRWALSVQSATIATEAVPVSHTQDGVPRTNLVVYRTTDGGDH